MTSKNPELTKKELTALCRKQEEYIKELEKKIEDIQPRTTEECIMPSKPSYEELECERDRMREHIRQCDFLIKALEDSLIFVNRDRDSRIQECEWYKEANYKLRVEVKENDK